MIATTTRFQLRDYQRRAVDDVIANERGYQIGWADYRFRDIFGHWPRGFVEEVRREVCA